MVFPVRSATEAIIHYLENASIATTSQFKRQGDAGTVFYAIGIVRMEFIPEDATVNKTRHKEILGRLRYSIRRKSPKLWLRTNWLLIHDNAPTRRSVLVHEELARQQVTVLPHLPYSPDLPPCGFCLSQHESTPTWA